VLRLLGTELDGPEIARELFVSPNTVRTHTKDIYAELGVHDRRAAARRAEDLGLTSRTSGQESGRAGVRDQWHQAAEPSLGGEMTARRARSHPASGGLCCHLAAGRSTGSPHQSPRLVIRAHHIRSYLSLPAANSADAG
jgi:hypothetical protein